jgi:uncharacterized protein
MRWIGVFVLLATSLLYAQLAPSSNTISVTGDADVKVAPDRVTVSMGVESRDKDIGNASAQNDAAVKRVIAAIRRVGVDASDIQTDFFHVEISYLSGLGTVVDFYRVTKEIQVELKDVSKFESLLNAALHAGANHVYGTEFSTSELRKYRDQARALAAKAAIEKANDLAAAAGLQVVGKPLSVSSYSYGGGAWYGRCCGYYGGSNFAQNVVQNVPGGSDTLGGSVALGKINVTASVTMMFQIQ